MKHAHFHSMIANSSASRISRVTSAHYVLSHSEVLTDLIAIALNSNDKNHHKACWILELVFEDDISLIVPYLDNFCQSLSGVSNESALRSLSKICMFLSKQQAKESKTGGEFLSQNQLQLLTETCFDWLISDIKVATKAYSMRTLFEIGKLQDWVYPQLTAILEKDFHLHTAAYHAASKELLRKMHKI